VGSLLKRTITRSPQRLNSRKKHLSGNRRIPVFTYHAVFPSYDDRLKCPPADAWYALTAAQFEAQMQFLAAEGFTTALLAEFLDGRAPRHSVVITFDDGYESNIKIVLPILMRFGFRAEFFVTVSFIGQPGFMNWEDLGHLLALGMSVQSHGLHHRRLTKLSDNELQDELQLSKNLLEVQLTTDVKYLAIPGGFTNQQIYREASLAGYAAVCNSEPSLARKSGIVPRIAIVQSTSQRTFESLARGEFWPLLRMRAKREFGKAAKVLLGVRRYEGLKAWGLRSCASPERQDRFLEARGQ
jgi:peptidoglycan/xylan/chitin deacetylase (PgdA/CDA1 family)